MSSVASSAIEQKVRAWLNHFVVGLNLCPFARPVVSSNSLRIHVCESDRLQLVAETFMDELLLIQRSLESEIATTLLVFPNALNDFDEYLSFIENAEEQIEEMGLIGIIQLASFHPDYQFDGEPADSVSHFTNRSPYPVIHFLREEMVGKALENFSHPEEIPENNIRTMESIGRKEIEKRWKSLK